VNVFQERDQPDQALVVGVAFPRVEDNGVFPVLPDVSGICVDDNDLGQVSIEIGQVL